MKVRWMCGSVRLRITPTELETLQRGEPVRETLFVDGGWSAMIRPGAQATNLTQVGAGVCLHIAEADIARLSAPEAEGVYFQEDGDPPFRYYIEKDFPCAHPRPTEATASAWETFDPTDAFHERKEDSSGQEERD